MHALPLSSTTIAELLPLAAYSVVFAASFSMRCPFKALAVVCLLVPSTASQATTLPQCAIGCARTASIQDGCDLSDTPCLCKTNFSTFSSNVEECAGRSSCSQAEQAQVKSILGSMCAAASSSPSASGSSTTTSPSSSFSASGSSTTTPPSTSSSTTTSPSISLPTSSEPSSTSSATGSAPSTSPSAGAAARNRGGGGMTVLLGAAIVVGVCVCV